MCEYEKLIDQILVAHLAFESIIGISKQESAPHLLIRWIDIDGFFQPASAAGGVATLAGSQHLVNGRVSYKMRLVQPKIEGHSTKSTHWNISTFLLGQHTI